MRLGSLRVATALLAGAFVYDIFWVFLSGKLFGSSVMLKVATAGAPSVTRKMLLYCWMGLVPCPRSDGLPLLVKVPHVGGWNPAPAESMLGLGDIALPGLLVAYVCRHDAVAALLRFAPVPGAPDAAPGGGYSAARPAPDGLARGGYYAAAMAGYAVGLAMAYGFMLALRHLIGGQPALLYLVPCTLGAVVLVAWRRDRADGAALYEGGGGAGGADGRRAHFWSLWVGAWKWHKYQTQACAALRDVEAAAGDGDGDGDGDDGDEGGENDAAPWGLLGSCERSMCCCEPHLPPDAGAFSQSAGTYAAPPPSTSGGDEDDSGGGEDPQGSLLGQDSLQQESAADLARV